MAKRSNSARTGASETFDALDRLMAGKNDKNAQAEESETLDELDDTEDQGSELAEMEDNEELDELDDTGDDYDDSDGDNDGDTAGNDVDKEADTHGAFDGRHQHGKFGMHSHDGDGDHADASVAMSDVSRTRRMVGEGDEVKRLREENARFRFALYEHEIEDQLAAWSKGSFALKDGAKSATKRGGFTVSRSLREGYKAFMLSDGLRLSDRSRARLAALVGLAISNGVVDLSARSAGSYDPDGRLVGGARSKAYALDESDRLEREAERIALSEHHMTTTQLSQQAPDKLLAIYERAQAELSR